MKRLFFLCFLVLYFSFFVFSQGLQFFGSEKDIKDRSSLVIPADESKLKKVREYGIDFEIRNHNLDSPGTILCVRNRDGKEVFSLTYSYELHRDTATFIFAKTGEKAIYSTKLSGREVLERNLPVSIGFDTTKGLVKVHIANDTTTAYLPDIINIDFSPQLFFGMSRDIVECASVSVRNLKITLDEETQTLPLTESEGENVHNSKGKVVGKVTNPVWLINRSFEWEQVWRIQSSTPTGFVYDQIRQNFYSYNADSLRVFHILSKDQMQIPLTGENPERRLGMNIFNDESGDIYPYEIYHIATIAKIDPTTGISVDLDTIEPRAVLHHHSNAFRKKDNSILLFGGYGNRAYSGVLIRFDLTTHSWDTIPLHGDKIDPRFFSSMMMSESEDTIFIYGGKGNSEGKQDLGLRYYYDFYQIDLNSGKTEKLWEQPVPDEDKVPVRTLIADSDNNLFYAMTYKEYSPHTSLQLYRINISDGTSEAVGDTISMVSEEIATNVTLYDDNSLEQIYCVVQEFAKNGETTTTVYSIVKPPVSSVQLINYSGKSSLWLKYLLIGIAVILISFVLFRIIRTKRAVPKSVPSDAATSVESIVNNDTEEVSTEISSSFPEMPDRNRISLFGPFTAIDSSGRDITYLFSPKLKAIFLYILLNSTVKNGVTSADLGSVFWTDKEPDKIKNLRNVTLNKLRKAMADIEGIALVYEQGVFRVEISDVCYCDYQRIYSLSSSLRDTDPDQEKSSEINAIFIRGNFLADTVDPIFDYFRQQIEAYMTEYLSERIISFFNKGKFNIVSRLCNALLRIDPVSEHALLYGIRSYKSVGRNDRAMTIYSSFIKEYRKMMGEEYPKRYDNIS